MTGVVCLLALLLAAPQGRPKAFPVESTFAKTRDFAAFHTYAWGIGHESYDRAVHKIIVDLIDSEMASLGFTRVESDAADVSIRYHSVLSLEVDLKAPENRGKQEPMNGPPLSRVGLLTVVMRDRGGQELWTAKTRGHMDAAASHDGIVRGAVSRIFETYPGRKSRSPKP
jgi:hypothetical protein